MPQALKELDMTEQLNNNKYRWQPGGIHSKRMQRVVHCSVTKQTSEQYGILGETGICLQNNWLCDFQIKQEEPHWLGGKAWLVLLSGNIP